MFKPRSDRILLDPDEIFNLIRQPQHICKKTYDIWPGSTKYIIKFQFFIIKPAQLIGFKTLPAYIWHFRSY